MSYNKVFRIIENEDNTKSIGPEVKLVAYGIDASEEDLLKQWVQANYLPLTGGTLTGELVIKSLNYDASGDTTDSWSFPIRLFDGDNLLYAGIAGSAGNSSSEVALRFYYDKTNTQKFIPLGMRRGTSGNAYAFTYTPPVDAANGAIQNKESVTRDFLPRTGGEMSGAISINVPGKRGGTNAVKSSKTLLRNYDEDGLLISDITSSIYQDGKTGIYMQSVNHFNNADIYSYVNAYAESDGTTYVAIPHPRGIYINDGATAGWVMDYAPKKLTTNTNIYIHPGTGSDTADLHNGRGLTQDKPFKTLSAAVHYAETHMASCRYEVQFVLLADTSIDNLHFNSNNFARMVLMASDPSINLSIADGIVADSGELYVFNITLTPNSSTAWAALQAFANGYITIGTNLTINGGTTDDASHTYANVRAIDGGIVKIHYTVTAISGSATGKRYYCSNGGMIISNGKGVNAIPGTVAGTADANSKYI